EGAGAGREAVAVIGSPVDEAGGGPGFVEGCWKFRIAESRRGAGREADGRLLATLVEAGVCPGSVVMALAEGAEAGSEAVGGQ
ncbi:hypothetical protein C9939_04720, partial [Pseudidiomarina aestuarii]